MLIGAVCSWVAVCSGFLEEGPGAAADTERVAERPPILTVSVCLEELSPADCSPVLRSLRPRPAQSSRQVAVAGSPAVPVHLHVVQWGPFGVFSPFLGFWATPAAQAAAQHTPGRVAKILCGQLAASRGGLGEVPVVLRAPRLPGDVRDLLASLVGKTILSLHVVCV